MRAVSLGHRLRITRGNVQAAAFDRALHAFARVRWAFPDAHPSRFDVVLERDVPYAANPGAGVSVSVGPGAHARDPDHTLDVYMPMRAAKPLPTILYVHGGGFSMLSKETHRGMALGYARRGYLVFLINYRLGPKHRFPAPLEDACEAMLWAHANCARYGGDPSRFAIAGESAGGNLVTALTVASCIRRPEPFAARLFDAAIPLRATIATYGFLDLEGHTDHLEHPRLPAVVKDLVIHATAAYVGLDVRAGCAAAPLASPLRLLEGADAVERPLPPFFADAGTRDPLLRDSKRLKAAVERLGGSCHLHVAPGEMHGYDALPWRPAAKEKWRAVRAFLDPLMVRSDEHAEAPTAAPIAAPIAAAE